MQRDLEDLAAITPAVAVGAAQVHVRQELHLDVLEAVAAADRTAAIAGVEAEGADRVAALLRERLGGEQLADRIERADIAGRIGTSRATDRCLIHHHHAAECSAPSITSCVPGASVGLPKCLSSAGYSTSWISVDFPDPDTPVTHTRRLQRNLDVDALQVVLACAAHDELRNVSRSQFAAQARRLR